VVKYALEADVVELVYAFSLRYGIIHTMKPLNKVKIEWSPKFAYVVGLIATDGNLSSDGRHVHFTSKDAELTDLFKKGLNLSNTIGKKSNGRFPSEKKYYVIQFGDVIFYRFLMDIGLMPCKSKKLGEIKMPHEFFYHFLRGCIDGDGNIHEFKHPESQWPQLRIRLVSASYPFLVWIKSITTKVGIKGYYGSAQPGIYVLEFAKGDSIKLINLIYKDKENYFLERKFKIASKYLLAGVA